MSYIMFTFFMVILHFLVIYIVVDNVDNFVDNFKFTIRKYCFIRIYHTLAKNIATKKYFKINYLVGLGKAWVRLRSLIVVDSLHIGCCA